MNESEVINGITKIIENSNALYDDAEFLNFHNRIFRAYSIYQLSIEEIAKALILLSIVLFDDLSSEKSQKKIRNVILNHKYKTKISIKLEVILCLAMKNRNEKIFSLLQEYQNVDDINDKKNYGFYTSIINNCFKSPKELLSKLDVDEIKTKAFIRIKFGEIVINHILEKIDYYKFSFKELSVDQEILNKIENELNSDFCSLL